MKTKTTILAAVLLTALSFSAFATDPENKETIARLLPHKEAGLVKLLYMSPTSKRVIVKFHGEEGIIIRDYINNVDGGFTKVYDLNKLETGDYTIEIIGKRILN
jgi:hypothetical protein